MRRVIKLGGSLLDDPQLVPRLRAGLARQPPAANGILVGGGRLVDALRVYDELHGIRRMGFQPVRSYKHEAQASELCRSDSLACASCSYEKLLHWLAIRAMSLNAELLSALLPESQLCAIWPAEEHAGLWIIDPWPVLRTADAAGELLLPHSWDVTSDSIAAWLAARSASELVLLKSTLPASCTLTSAAAEGYVDRYFPQAAQDLPRARCVNLRDAGFPERLMES
jgi:hypothetical protein